MTPCYYCEADGAACKTCIHSDTYIDPQEEITKLREQVASQAAVLEKFKSALRSCYSDWHGDTQVQHFNIGLVYEALSIPTDSTQILDEVRRAERERCAKMILNGRFLHDESPAAQFAKEVAEAIRAME